MGLTSKPLLLMIDFKKLAEIITANHSFLITTHVNPDADAIGSEIAFYKIVKQLGKKAVIINHSSTPYNLRFLDQEDIINKYDYVEHNKYFQSSDVFVALDFNRADRMVSMKNDFINFKKLKICIDHHQDPEDFVDHYFNDTDYAATGHILYDLIIKTNIINITEDIAAPLYAAIMTDTGSFRFERTTAKLHRIVADLLDTGINPTNIYNNLYDESKLSKIKLLGKCLNSLQIISNNKIAYMTITQQDFNNTNAIESDTENFVNIILSIEEVRLGILFIQLKNGFKVSFRSKGDLQVNILAGKFGGGGHINASGARFIDSEMNIMIPDILAEAEKFFLKYFKGQNV